MIARLAWVRQLCTDARASVLNALESAAKMGPLRRMGLPGSSIEFDAIRRDFPNFKEVLDFVWRRALLAGNVVDSKFGRKA